MLRQTLLTQRALDAVTTEVGAEAEQVHVRHIMVATEQEAQDLLALLAAGADFAALAREHSQDLATRDSGGDLGWFPRGVVAPELEQAAFALQAGEVSDPVRLGEGVHIILVEEREPNRALSPEVQLDMRLAIFDAWLSDLRAAAEVERFVGE
jgi:parvulin-like peptidyl-prolyl isomerase